MVDLRSRIGIDVKVDHTGRVHGTLKISNQEIPMIFEPFRVEMTVRISATQKMHSYFAGVS